MPIDLRLRLTAVTALSTLVLLASAAPVTAVTRSVTMVDDRFKPPSVTVTVGTTVRWVNRGSSAHTVTSRTNGQFDSSLVQPGGGFSYTFSRAGTYRYYCFLHDGMNGVVTVKAAPRPTARPTPRRTTRPRPGRPTPRAGGGGGGGRPTQPPTDTISAPSDMPMPTPQEPMLLVLLGGGAIGGVLVGHRRLASVRALRG